MRTTGWAASVARTSRHDISAIRRVTVISRFLVLEPPLGDVRATGEPDVRVALGVGDESVETVGPAGHPGHPAVEAHRHHLGRGGPFLVERVESLLGRLVEVVAGGIVPPPEAGIVERQRVGDDQPRPVAYGRVIRQVVVVRVAVVEEPAVLDDQLARLLARAVAAVPPERPLAGEPLDPRVALGDGPALGLAVHQVVLLPPVAVTANVVALLGD